MFVDRVKIDVKAGDGGNGIAAFRREKYVPLGGPAGGDGGKGGDIVFEVDTNKSTLLDLRFNRLIKAENGGKGLTKKMHGADGEDVIVKVPQGTIVKDAKTGKVLADLVHVNQREIIAKGGRGGRGNWHFATSRNSAPDYAELGQDGESIEIEIELKILADAGLVGFPSVGKSTLLSVVTKAKPEIAAYHFTTIQPNLGVVQVKDGRSFVLADLPGLIEGAALGKGLGHQFLRHIERCRVLIHVIDMGASDGRDPINDYEVINAELEAYQMRLLERPQIIVANKMDLDDAQENLAKFKAKYPDLEVFETTTIINEGLEPVMYRVADLLATTPEFPLFTPDKEDDDHVLYTFKAEDKGYYIKKISDHEFDLSGPRVMRLFKTIDFNKDEDVYRFGATLKKMGVDDDLRSAGAKDGDSIIIDKFRFDFVE